jgi:hypothetical protein
LPIALIAAMLAAPRAPEKYRDGNQPPAQAPH